MSDIRTDNLVLILISLAHIKLTEKKEYFRRLLLEGTKLGENNILINNKLGLMMLLMGNKNVQDNFLEVYKDSQRNSKTGQYFLQGMQKIFALGKRSYLSQSKDNFNEVLFWFSCMLMHNMCEGHNTIMQNFMREQEFVGIDVDLVGALAKVCSSMTEKVLTRIIYIDSRIQKSLETHFIVHKEKYLCFIDWSKTIDLPSTKDLLILGQVLKSITELAQGPCFANQKVFVQSNVVRPLMKLLLFITSYFYEGIIHKTNYNGNTKAHMILIAQIAQSYQLHAEANDIMESMKLLQKDQLIGNQHNTIDKNQYV